MTRIAQQREAAGQRVRRKALQPEERFCRLLRRAVTILVEYSDYQAPYNKGPEGEIYCGNLIECYQKGMECRYSGISPLYPDPFEGVPRDVREAKAMFGVSDETAEDEADSAEEPEQGADTEE
ncbi:MAG: hypothetical protein EB084_12495 [Proteobacteria bacterium]|nr:hypothetical protein [Pseudomonadota bacterium]